MIGQAPAGLGRRATGRAEIAKSIPPPPNYRETSRVRPVHAAEATAGAGLLAYGAPQTAAAVTGRPLPPALADVYARLAFARTPEAVEAVVRAVPRRYRPHVATLAGVALLRLAQPVVTEHKVRSRRR